MEKLCALCTKLEKMENLNKLEIRTMAQALKRYMCKPKPQNTKVHQKQTLFAKISTQQYNLSNALMREAAVLQSSVF